MLKPGLSQEITFTVTPEFTAEAVGSGTLPVLATPILIAKLEQAAWMAVSNDLPQDNSTVGTHMNVRHLSPTPIGMTVICKADLTQVDERKLVFHVSAQDQVGPVGEGIHERVIIQSSRFLAKAQSKKGSES